MNVQARLLGNHRDNVLWATIKILLAVRLVAPARMEQYVPMWERNRLYLAHLAFYAISKGYIHQFLNALKDCIAYREAKDMNLSKLVY
jgi:hypothetical protein